jgi:hypothetical protein
MQTQTSFAELEGISKKKLTRRERFLAQIEAATPWACRWLLAPQGLSAVLNPAKSDPSGPRGLQRRQKSTAFYHR